MPDVAVSSLKALGHDPKAAVLPCRTGCIRSDPNGSTSKIAAQFSSLYWKKMTMTGLQLKLGEVFLYRTTIGMVAKARNNKFAFLICATHREYRGPIT